MVELRDKSTGAAIGVLNDEQFQALSGELEEESSTDNDYYLSRETLDMFEEDGLDASVVSLLRQAMGGRAELEVVWTRTDAG